MSKCTFAQESTEYLGNVVSKDGVHVDQRKVQAMLEWPVPSNLKQLRGFLGLTGYYRKFVQGYALIARPLTDLLKKNKFLWSEEATVAFEEFKDMMTKTPVLKLPDFRKTFVVETDASNVGIGAVLTQEGHPLAYFSKKLTPRLAVASAYVRELYAVTQAVLKWRNYLLGRRFVIKTDHRSLRDLMSQVIQTQDQQFYLTKLLGFDYEIVYCTGKSNGAADALLRQGEGEPKLFSFTVLRNPIVAAIVKANEENEELWMWHEQYGNNELGTDYKVREGVLYYQNRIIVPNIQQLKQEIFKLHHEVPVAGHGGFQKTYRANAETFYWPKMRKEIMDFTQQCTTCQQIKYTTQKKQGPLQPLPVPSKPW